MLTEYPQVRPLFNQAHQASGDQARALANGVLMYARHIDQLEVLGPLVSRIVAKHVALQILPEHYPIVGTACCAPSARSWARTSQRTRSSTPGPRPMSCWLAC